MATAVGFKKVAELPASPLITTFYLVNEEDLYLGSKKLNNAEDLTAAITRIAANETAITALQTLVNKLDGDDTVEGSVRNLIANASTGTTISGVTLELVTDPEIDGTVEEGTFIKFSSDSGDPVYADVSTLIEYNSVESTSEVILSDTAHTIKAEIGKIDASKIIYEAEDPTSGTTEKTLRDKLEAMEISGGASFWEEEDPVTPTPDPAP